jgi:type IV pilus assembly protein PilY1
MKRIGCIAAILLLAAGSLAPGSAAAQGDPDLREILPYLMLVIDTSGSMERLPACTCDSPSCLNCLPLCDLANVDGQPPTDPPSDPNGRQLKKNRWATTLEALTGTFNDFQCTALERTIANGATFDVNYFTPYHQPWDCTSGGACPFTAMPANYQNSNGILDQYSTRVRFGLMTFDGFDTYVGATSEVPASSFDIPRSNAVTGLWSYGGPKPFNYPGCDYDYMMDTGARSTIAAEGTLVSINSCVGGGAPGGSTTCPAWCTSCDGDQGNVNRDIQEALLSARPYGGTPIAASLDDLYYHLRNDVTDTFGGCRNRFALLVTDGEPDPDYYDVGCDCANQGDPMDDYRCCPEGAVACDPTRPAYDWRFKKCPYPSSEDAARDLVLGRTGDTPQIERLFVVGMAVEDPNVLARLDRIADMGCNEDDCDTDNDGHDALFANDLDALVANLSEVINSLIEPISRSVPAFAAGNQDANVKQYQISTGFEVATENGAPWTGVIERRRFSCNASGDLVESQLEDMSGDRFHYTLNNRVSSLRNLQTVLPPGAAGEGWGAIGAPAVNGHLFRGESSSPCGVDGCPAASFTGSLHPLNFGLTASNTLRRDEIVGWMRGEPDSPRANKKLGDIYHSSPVIVGAPRFDTADEAFNLFRQRPDILGRPLTMYIGTNDGILHAFSVEPYTTPAGLTPQRTFVAGEEMWGFVPPIVLDDVEDNIAQGRLWSMDGTPVVKNVYFNRTAGQSATASEYHTVLITGMRQGGNAYIALDVTDPAAPVFLWQFTDPQMGLTFAQPAIAQAIYTISEGGTNVIKNGAVAILPGGVGQTGALSGECTTGTNESMAHQSTGSVYTTLDAVGSSTGFNHRADIRCWRDQGRALYFVEVETGRLLKKIYTDPDTSNTRVFPSPLVSTPAIYQADVGTLTTQAYVVDADGVIWRIDMSSADQVSADPMTGWTARPFHDIFHGRLPDEGELTYEAPILSVDRDGRVVVIVGTGDNNNFVKPTVENRVVSLTEVRDTAVTGTVPERFKAAMNWEMRVKAGTTGPRLVASELVTGTMGLFNGTLFFGTFIAITGADACDMGKGRIHAVHYLNRDTTQPNDDSGTYAPVLNNEVADDTSAIAINIAPENAIDNLMLMGLGLTQRPSCTIVDPDQTFDVWGESLTPVTSLADPAIYLVAQGSGDRNATTLLQRRQGSNLGSVELRLDKPSTLSRIVSWATSTD